MITQDLLKYIREQLAAGVPRDTISSTLAQHGWTPRDITDGFAAVTVPRTATPTAQVTRPVIQTAQLPSYRGRKVLLSSVFVALSMVYGYSRYLADAQAPDSSAIAVADQSGSTPNTTTTDTSTQTPSTTTTTPSTFVPVPVVVPTKPTTTPTPVTTPTPPTPTPTPVVVTPPPVVKPKGQYTDGSYTGDAADALYGTIQVKAVISGGKLTDVVFLQYPNDRRTSVQINQQAMPRLKQEAISAQSANVNGVSGATDSSQAFIQSLGSALSQAKA